jgi:hypothetical protein
VGLTSQIGASLLGVALGGLGAPIAVSPTPVPADGSSLTAFVQVASVPGGGMVAVFEDHQRSLSRTDVSAVRFDGAGLRLDPQGIVLSDSRSTNWDPAVACNGSNCLVVWRRPGVDVVAATLDAVTGMRGAVHTVQAAEGLSSVASTGSGFVVLTQSGATLLSQALDASGAAVGPSAQLATDANTDGLPVLLAGTSGVLAAWWDTNGTIRSRMLDLQARPITAVRTHATDSQLRVSGTWDGSRYALAWGTSASIVMQRLDAAGALVDASGVQVVGAAAQTVALAYDGTSYLLAWATATAEASVIRVDSATLTTGGPVAVAPFPGGVDRLHIGVGGRNLLSLEDANNDHRRYYRAFTFASLGDGGWDVAPMLGGGLVRQSSSPSDFAAAGSGAGFQVVWSELADTGDVVRTQALTAQAALRGPPQQVSSGGWLRDPTVGFAGSGGHLFWSNGPPGATYGDGLWWASLDSTGSSVGTPTLLVGDVRSEPRGNFATWAGVSALVWAGQIGGLQSGARVARVPDDGGQPLSPVLASSAVGAPTASVLTASADAGLFVWGEWLVGLHWMRLSPQLSFVDAPHTQSDGFMQVVAAASNGQDFLAGYVEGWETARVQLVRIGANGTALGPGVTVSPPADMPYSDRSLSIAYDGRAYRVAYEVGGDGGTDIVWRRVWADGGIEGAEALVAGPDDEESPVLVEGGPGRLLVLWRQRDAAADSLRLYARTWTELPIDAPCANDSDCASGLCAGAGTCCDFDAGPCAPSVSRDAGTHAQEASPLALRVCGCGETGTAGPLVLLLNALLRPRRSTRWVEKTRLTRRASSSLRRPRR